MGTALPPLRAVIAAGHAATFALLHACVSTELDQLAELEANMGCPHERPPLDRLDNKNDYVPANAASDQSARQSVAALVTPTVQLAEPRHMIFVWDHAGQCRR